MSRFLPDRSDCCGCFACYSVCAVKAIMMVPNEEGFLMPIIDEKKCVGCGQCVRACPVLHISEARKPLKCYAAKSQNREIIKLSSSGGIFSDLSGLVLSSGGCVFGCVLDKDGEFHAVHKLADSYAEMAEMRGSKYVQSELNDIYRQVESELNLKRKVLFSGTPCQVAALKRYLRHDYSNLLCVEVVCHGVGSYSVLRKYLNELSGTYKSRAKEVRFKDKSHTEDGTSFCVKFENGEEFVARSYDSAYGRAFMSRWCVRLSCGACRFRAGRSGADITIGDYWGIESFHPSFGKAGNASVVIVWTNSGEAAIRDANVELLQTSWQKATCYNPSIYKNQPRIWLLRKRFFHSLKHMSVVDAVRSMDVFPWNLRIRQRVQHAISTVKARWYLRRG